MKSSTIFELTTPITNASSNNLSPGPSNKLFSPLPNTSKSLLLQLSISNSMLIVMNTSMPLATSSSPSLSRSRKKLRRPDGTGQRLQRLEELHIERRRVQRDDSLSSSDTDSSSSEEVDEAVSTSEYAIYGENEEPSMI
ncbi:hypothetical protein V6N11_061647 [Hibiscus sabdariffa]|uniref:Uncharacterized protein n=1 Tax=Hibiscus sabdariffa TaxID=183260 RepID=A0ABR1ZSJ3_9ROSI